MVARRLALTQKQTVVRRTVHGGKREVTGLRQVEQNPAATAMTTSAAAPSEAPTTAVARPTAPGTRTASVVAVRISHGEDGVSS